MWRAASCSRRATGARLEVAVEDGCSRDRVPFDLDWHLRLPQAPLRPASRFATPFMHFDGPITRVVLGRIHRGRRGRATRRSSSRRDDDRQAPARSRARVPCSTPAASSTCPRSSTRSRSTGCASIQRIRTPCACRMVGSSPRRPRGRDRDAADPVVGSCTRTFSAHTRPRSTISARRSAMIDTSMVTPPI